MRFTTKTLLSTILLVFAHLTLADSLWGSVLWGEGAAKVSPPQITILVFDKAQVRESVLAAAEQQASVIFRQAGVEITWRNCMPISGADPACHQVPDSTHFVVSIIPRGQKRNKDVFGVAFLDEAGIGKYTDVFFDAIANLPQAEGVNEASLLGAVTAHEVGHLLLGLHSHSAVGVMSARWQHEQLSRLGMGSFWFSPDQASRMHQRIRDGQRRVSLQLARAGNCSQPGQESSRLLVRRPGIILGQIVP